MGNGYAARNIGEQQRKRTRAAKRKKTLILSLTHDIRTPLSAIRLYAKALAENLYTTEEQRVEACQGIEKNVKEIEEYVNEITLASREDFLQLSVNPGEVYLSHVIDAIRGLYEENCIIYIPDFRLHPTRICC